jgi:glycosyltransferase involved in cell wall biosynthesis
MNMQTVDVVILTRNSGKTLGKCLNSVYNNVPINRLTIIDRHSADNTLKTLNEFNARYGNIRIIDSNGSRGSARQTGIENVTTEWFLFVDSDVVLCRDWFKKASEHMCHDVGAIWGVDIPGDIRNALLIKISGWMEKRVFKIRGGCHDILIRTCTVKDIKIPPDLHTLEDAYIKEWITSKSYKIVIDSSAMCRHYKSSEELFSRENSMSMIRELKKSKLVKERLVYAAFFALVWLLQGNRFRKRSNLSENSWL